MIRLVALLTVLALTISPAIAQPPEIYRIEVSGPLPADPLMGFSIAIGNGRVAQLPDCPAGWTINLVNDANWQATIKGHAIEGSSSITIRMLERLFLVGGVPQDIAEVFKGPTSAKGKLTFMRNGELFTVDAPHTDLVPLPPRHR